MYPFIFLYFWSKNNSHVASCRVFLDCERGPCHVTDQATSLKPFHSLRRSLMLYFQVDCSLVGAGGQLPSLAFLREAASMLMLRYPSRLGNLFIVNSGNVIYYLWQAISRLLPPVRLLVDEFAWYV